jgi:hypothetical protein
MATLGGTAPSSHTWNLDALLTTTLMNVRELLVDNIFKYNSFLAAMRAYGGVKKVSGGVQIQCPLMYEEHTHAQSYSGYDTISVIPQDGITSAFYRWAELASTITISRREERQNSGEEAILSLLEAKTMQAEMSLKALLNRQIVQGTVSSATFVEGNSEKDMYPLGYFLRKLNATDPTTSDVGNIAADTYSWWRARAANIGSNGVQTGNDFALNVTTLAGLPIALRRMQNYCARGADGSSPNIVLMDQVSYETYVNALDTKMRYSDSRLADLGFDTVKLGGASVIWDEVVPDIQTGTTAITKGTSFHVNTRFMKLIFDTESEFIVTPFVTPENQTARTAKVLAMGNLTCDNMRKIGVCYDILQTIAA